MRSNAAKALLGIAAVASAVVLFVVLSDDGDGGEKAATTTERPAAPAKQDRKQPRSEPPKPQVPTVVVRNGQPLGGVLDLAVERGERVRFRVSSDVSDEVHVHGYDLSKEVAAGGSVGFGFTADIEGIFAVELEHRAEPIAELTVSP